MHACMATHGVLPLHPKGELFKVHRAVSIEIYIHVTMVTVTWTLNNPPLGPGCNERTLF